MSGKKRSDCYSMKYPSHKEDEYKNFEARVYSVMRMFCFDTKSVPGIRCHDGRYVKRIKNAEPGA